jgi:hypothetical protein
VHLWDAVAYVLSEMHELPGRRMILVVSDGWDTGSKRSWNEVRGYAQSTGATIFGMTYLPPYMTDREQTAGNPFQALCGLTGGLVLSTSRNSLEERLRRFTAILRERYIVEFPRPANATAGEHTMQVKVEKSGPDLIRWAGATVPIADAAVLADPTTVRSDPSLSPQQGKQ